MRLGAFALSLVVAAGCVIGCQPEDRNPSSNPKFLAKIHEKARQLAEKEMAKFNAIELTYKEVDDSMGNISPVDASVKVYFRAYRDFVSYEIKDLQYRPESLTKPLTFVIQFNYRTLATPLRNSPPGDAEKQSLKETPFTVFVESNVLRAYPCDPDGNYDGSLPEMPPRGNIFLPAGYAASVKTPQPTSPPAL